MTRSNRLMLAGRRARWPWWPSRRPACSVSQVAREQSDPARVPLHAERRAGPTSAGHGTGSVSRVRGPGRTAASAAHQRGGRPVATPAHGGARVHAVPGNLTRSRPEAPVTPAPHGPAAVAPVHRPAAGPLIPGATEASCSTVTDQPATAPDMAESPATSPPGDHRSAMADDPPSSRSNVRTFLRGQRPVAGRLQTRGSTLEWPSPSTARRNLSRLMRTDRGHAPCRAIISTVTCERCRRHPTEGG